MGSDLGRPLHIVMSSPTPNLLKEFACRRIPLMTQAGFIQPNQRYCGTYPEKDPQTRVLGRAIRGVAPGIAPLVAIQAVRIAIIHAVILAARLATGLVAGIITV